MLFLWIIIGTVIGVMANMAESPFAKKSVLLSVVLGIVGACFGGLICQTLPQSSSTFSVASPLFYTVSGAFLLAMIPNKGNIL